MVNLYKGPQPLSRNGWELGGSSSNSASSNSASSNSASTSTGKETSSSSLSASGPFVELPQKRERSPSPEKIPFNVTLLGIDQHAYVYIHKNSLEDWKAYSRHLIKMKRDYDERRQLIPYDKLREKMKVVAKVGTMFNWFYIRAVVVRKNPPNRLMLVLNVDEQLEFEVPKEQLYFSTRFVKELPNRTIKCRLDGLESFAGLDIIQKSFQRLRYLGSKYSAVLIKETPRVILRLKGSDGKDLTKNIISVFTQLDSALFNENQDDSSCSFCANSIK